MVSPLAPASRQHALYESINQVVTQLSPILLMLGGIAVFHERFSWIRWLGFALLLVGFGSSMLCALGASRAPAVSVEQPDGRVASRG